MCKCTPEIRTPFCGRPGCEWPKQPIVFQISKEILVHFKCQECQKWWAIGDAPLDRREWWCPWCGTKSDNVYSIGWMDTGGDNVTAD